MSRFALLVAKIFNIKKKVQVIGVGGLILNKKGEILLTQRNEPSFPIWDGKWGFPGGHLEFGEEPKERLRKEIKEELGVEVEILKDNPFVTSGILDLGGLIYHGILLCYPCQITKGKLKITNQENRDFKWFNPREIDFQNCLPFTDIFVKQFLKELGTRRMKWQEVAP
ncbi:MAG: NUDIX hydrolase [Microgenomates group bacterium LiPW_16]|nr:MAG: NUDIX hydrolase [Microgenomates group bacterium LiPW_16]